MKILITGAGGQLAYDLVRILSSEHELFPMTKQELNITDYDKATEIVRNVMPDAIIHAAAFTNVDQAESNIELAYHVNALGTKNIAYAASRVGSKLVYISTDYVFDGNKGSPYAESDIPLPLGVYGYTKLLGEKFVEAFHEKSFILRTSWLFGKKGQNFVNKMVSLMQHRDQLNVVSDQIGSPTYSHDLAVFISHLLKTEKYGVYHASNRGYCSRFDFAKAIMEAMKIKNVTLLEAKLEDFKLAAQRPINSALDDMAIRANQLPLFRDWEAALKDYISKDFMISERGETIT